MNARIAALFLASIFGSSVYASSNVPESLNGYGTVCKVQNQDLWIGVKEEFKAYPDNSLAGTEVTLEPGIKVVYNGEVHTYKNSMSSGDGLGNSTYQAIDMQGEGGKGYQFVVDIFHDLDDSDITGVFKLPVLNTYVYPNGTTRTEIAEWQEISLSPGECPVAF